MRSEATQPKGEHPHFPAGFEFLEQHLRVSEKAAAVTDHLQRTSGDKLPKTTQGLGTVLSLLYRAACCSWGCNGGDHQLEWLVGRVVNQGNASFSLIRAASYDESLVLTRGIGEIANLFWLFQHDTTQLTAWQNADRRERLNNFGPAGVRKRLTEIGGMGPPIDSDRYQRLCEIGTHPVPNTAPSHFSGIGRPVLSGLVQPVGVYVATTELAFAVAMSAIPVAAVVIKDPEARQQLFDASVTLVRSLGSFTVLNYEELLAQVKSSEEPAEEQDTEAPSGQA
jgi:hypothetical protein